MSAVDATPYFMLITAGAGLGAGAAWKIRSTYNRRRETEDVLRKEVDKMPYEERLQFFMSDFKGISGRSVKKVAKEYLGTDDYEKFLRKFSNI